MAVSDSFAVLAHLMSSVRPKRKHLKYGNYYTIGEVLTRGISTMTAAGLASRIICEDVLETRGVLRALLVGEPPTPPV